MPRLRAGHVATLIPLMLLACAPRRAIVVTPELVQGTVARYRFSAEVRTALEQAGIDQVASTLDGLLEIEVLERSDAGARLRIRVEPTASTRDGEQTNPGPAQERRVLLRDDGSVIAEDATTGRPLGDAEVDPDALATLLRPRVPVRELAPGEGWRLDGVDGHVLGLAHDDGNALVRIELVQARDVSRQRVLDQRPVELTGIERSRAELLWNLDAGLPWSASIRSIATFEVRAGAQTGGTITIDARTSIEPAR